MGYNHRFVSGCGARENCDSRAGQRYLAVCIGNSNFERVRQMGNIRRAAIVD